ncbi:hypothetical protein LUZ60_015188 [Juncus effusus]|nr:hypothetical protein LUZ60_015188 [Juncus effusus]
MEITIASFLLFSVFLLSILLSIKPKTKQTLPPFPPGPKPLPLVGNLLQLGSTSQPHVTFTSLSKTYGPIFSLKLGQVTTIVISSKEYAKQVFQNHDAALAARHVPAALHVRNHHEWSMAWLAPGPRWRSLRRVCAMELFTTQRLDEYGFLRRQKVQELMDYISESAKQGIPVEIGRVAFTTSLNLLSRTIFSTDLADLSSRSSQQLKSVVSKLMEVGGSPNISDYFPILAKLDLQGKLKKMDALAEKLQVIIDEQIDRRMKEREDGSTAKNDFLDVLLGSQLGVEGLEDLYQLLRSLFSDLFVAGNDTSSSTVEWAMAELLNDPISMKKARDELSSVIGPKREMEESDINELPFLKAVVKETLRLHPPVPFLLPRRAQESVELGGFTIPKNSQVLINVWAIGRDETTWEDPFKFNPMRFLEREVDFRGRDFELIPFGAGRRICPGLPLAYRMVHLMLGSMLHRFEWKLPEETMTKGHDMSEKFGVTLCMASHLKAIAVPYKL